MRGKTAKALRSMAKRLCEVDGTVLETSYEYAWQPRKGEDAARIPIVLTPCARQKYQAMKAVYSGSKA